MLPSLSQRKHHVKDWFVFVCVCWDGGKSYKGPDELIQVQFVDFHHFFLNIFVNRGGHTTVLHGKKNLYSHQNWREIVHK